MNHFKEKAMKCVFLIAACTSVLAVFLICAFLFANGVPAIGKIGPLKFLLGTKWKPSNDIFGILPMIVASIYVTAGAILLGVPIALFTSVFMARYCPKKIYRPLKSGIDGRCTFYCIWFLWPDSHCSSDQTDFRRNRNQYAGSLCSAWNDDPADNHRSYGICDPQRTGELL